MLNVIFLFLILYIYLLYIFFILYIDFFYIVMPRLIFYNKKVFFADVNALQRRRSSLGYGTVLMVASLSIIGEELFLSWFVFLSKEGEVYTNPSKESKRALTATEAKA